MHTHSSRTLATVPPRSRRQRRAQTRKLLALANATQVPEIRESALEQAVLLNMEVARTLAAPYSGRGIAQDDLEQVAYTALVRAARDFDPKQADDFLAYAVPTVRGEVKKYFRDCGWAVRPPRRIQELQAAIASTRSALQQATGREPDLREIAEELGVPYASVDEAMAAEGCFTPSSLDHPVADGSATCLGDLIADEDDGFGSADARVMLGGAVRKLRPRDRMILRLRFYDGLTQQEIGDRIGVTQMQVSRLLSRILGELREELVGPLPQSA